MFLSAPANSTPIGSEFTLLHVKFVSDSSHAAVYTALQQGASSQPVGNENDSMLEMKIGLTSNGNEADERSLQRPRRAESTTRRRRLA